MSDTNLIIEDQGILDEIGPGAIEAYLLRTAPADRRPASLDLAEPARPAG